MDETPHPKVTTGQRVLVIDDEGVVCLSCARILGEDGHRVECHQDAREGLSAALTGDFDVILLDLVMPEIDGLEILERIKGAGVDSEVVIITGYSTVQTAVQAMKQGAADYVSKPFTPDELKRVLNKVFERSALIREIASLRQELETHQEFEGIIGESRSMERVFSLVKRVAPTEGTVLITGESGTGKEMIARAIHRLSTRRGGPLLACDCSSLASSLLESELFGHAKGSFSGAVAAKKGLFEAAHRGTLFLDEIGNVDLEIQAKLLRVLETRRIRKVGDTAERDVDIRLITATNRDLRKMVDEETFRQDLFYRLNVIPIEVPPLRERVDDIPLLAVAFLEHFKKRNDLKMERFSPEAMALFQQYDWPGNVRELKNIVERVAILCPNQCAEPRHLPAELQAPVDTALWSAVPDTWEKLKSLKRRVREAATHDLERRFVVEALRRSGGNVSKAAEQIGMQRTNLHALMRRFGLTSEDR